MAYKKHLVPLESDPEIFTQLAWDLGARGVCFEEIYGLDDDSLGALQRPVTALILILPECPAYEKQMREVKESSNLDKPVWLKQTINNACGLYAILHAICNASAKIEGPSPVSELLLLSTSERPKYLETSEKVEAMYVKAAERGSSEAPDAESDVEHHYICLVGVNGKLYELDGEMAAPVVRSDLDVNEDVLNTGIAVVKQYVESAASIGKHSFALMAMLESTI